MATRRELKTKRYAAKKMRFKALRRVKKRLSITGRVENFADIQLTHEDFR